MKAKRIIGCRTSSFTAQDGNRITGMNVWLAECVPSGEGDGFCSVERIYLSSKVLMSYTPCVGDDVIVHYNKYGKVAQVDVV